MSRFEADFRPCSHRFRPGHPTHDAIAEIHFFGSFSYEWVLGGHRGLFRRDLPFGPDRPGATDASLLRLSPGFGKLFDHRVRILVHQGRLRHRQLRLCGLTDDYLYTQVRERGVFDLARLRYVLYEAKGGLTVVPGDTTAGEGEAPLVQAVLDTVGRWRAGTSAHAACGRGRRDARANCRRQPGLLLGACGRLARCTMWLRPDAANADTRRGQPARRLGVFGAASHEQHRGVIEKPVANVTDDVVAEAIQCGLRALAAQQRAAVADRSRASLIPSV